MPRISIRLSSYTGIVCNKKIGDKTINENGKELNLSMLQPLDADIAANVLKQSGHLVPLTKWSRSKKDYEGNSDRFIFLICMCLMIGAALGSIAWYASSKQITPNLFVVCLMVGCVLGCVLFFGTPAKRKKVFKPKPETPVQTLENQFGVHVAGVEDQSLFAQTGFKHVLVRNDATHFSPATIFVWIERYNLEEERTWPMTYIALFDEDGKPIMLKQSTPQEDYPHVER